MSQEEGVKQLLPSCCLVQQAQACLCTPLNLESAITLSALSQSKAALGSIA